MYGSGPSPGRQALLVSRVHGETEIVATDDGAAASAHRRDAMAFVAIATVVLALGFGGGALLPRLRASRQVVEPPTALAGATSAMSRPTATDGQTGAVSGVRTIKDLAELPKGPVEQVEVAYFHRTNRCSGCIRAEALTRKTLDTYYSDRLKCGDMVLRVEDVEQPADPEVVRKYDAFGSSLYLGVLKGGVTYAYPVNDIWFTTGDDAKFMQVVRGKIDYVFEGQ
jgi:hypothetical protein